MLGNIDLKSINWKRQINTGIKVLMDFKVFGLLVLNGLVIYGIGWDTIVRPNLEGLSGRDTAINEQKKALEEKQALHQQYSVWEQQLKTLDTVMVTFEPGNSAKVASVSEAAELLELMSGKKRDATVLPALEPPHDVRDNVTLEPVTSEVVDILKPEGAAAQSAQAPAQPPTEISEGGGMPSAEAPAKVAETLMVERFDYDLKMTGTYPALVDALNQLVIWKKLIKINKITITKSEEAVKSQPNATEYPDYPMKLDMLVSISLYLHEANAPSSP